MIHWDHSRLTLRDSAADTAVEKLPWKGYAPMVKSNFHNQSLTIYSEKLFKAHARKHADIDKFNEDLAELTRLFIKLDVPDLDWIGVDDDKYQICWHRISRVVQYGVSHDDGGEEGGNLANAPVSIRRLMLEEDMLRHLMESAIYELDNTCEKKEAK